MKCIVLFISIFSLLLLFYIIKNCSSYETFEHISKVPNDFPLYDYKYLQRYFSIPYNFSRTTVIRKVQQFFGLTPIIFICLQSNQERFKNIRTIIRKYQLKNVTICNAVPYQIISKENNSVSVSNDGKHYFLESITSETEKEIACFLSHMKAILLAKEMGVSVCAIMEDDVNFDYIQYSSGTIQDYLAEIPSENSGLSLYTNKPNHSEFEQKFVDGNHTNGYYGAVAYVLPKNVIDSISDSIIQTNQIRVPKKTCLYIADHYIPSCCSMYRPVHSIIIPNNTSLESTLHQEKTNHHIQIQYEFMLSLYNRVKLDLKIPNVLYLFSKNKFIEYYRKFSAFEKVIIVHSFRAGVQSVYENGGCFMFANDTKLLLPSEINSLIECSSSYIRSIPKHPHLYTILEENIIKFDFNPKMFLKPSSKDFIFRTIPAEEKFSFIISSFNNEKWVEKNLLSILHQTYKHYEIFYVDDSSTDKTLELAKYFQKKHFPTQMTIISNKTRNYQAYSRYIAYRRVYPQNILVLLDGDDWLYDNFVLENIRQEYAKGYEATYGKAVFFHNGQVQHENYVKQEEYPFHVRQNKKFRKYKFFNVHLRTCRAKFLQSIPKRFLKNQDNKWLTHSTDMAEWFYIMEKTNGNAKFMNKRTYIYNRDNSEVHSNSWYHNKDSKERSDTINYIRNMKKD